MESDCIKMGGEKMRIHNRDWSITLGGPNRGQDLQRETEVARVKAEIHESMDRYKTGDNADVTLPTKNYEEELRVTDLDQNPDRVVADLSTGVVYSTTENGTVNIDQRKVVAEFDPTTGQPQRYSSTDGKTEYDVAFQSGEIKTITTNTPDGSYKEVVNFSNDGKVVAFQSTELLQEGASESQESWFLRPGFVVKTESLLPPEDQEFAISREHLFYSTPR